MNKKTIIIFSSLVLVASLAIALVLLTEKKGDLKNKNNPNGGVSNTTKKESTLDLADNKNNSITPNIILPVNQSPPDIKEFNQIFLDKNPSIGIKELSSFSEVLVNGSMGDCETLTAGADECKYYFATYYNDDGKCGDIEDGNSRFTCYKKLISNNLDSKFQLCNQKDIVDNKINCFNNIFWAITTTEACDLFVNDFIKQNCLDIVNLKKAINNDDKFCVAIENPEFREYCNSFFAQGDFDRDGLLDSQELVIGTDPYNNDTDNDGVFDKVEIDSNSNPCGDGVLPEPADLFKMCAKFKK